MRTATAGTMLSTVVADQVAAIASRTPGAVADEADQVHQLRTALRRLRTTLAVFRSGFAAVPARHLRHRLRTVAAVLGESRDLEVRVADLLGLAAHGAVPEPVIAPLVAELRHRHAGAHAVFAAWATTADAAALSATLSGWASDPPLRRPERDAATVATTALVAAADRTLSLGTALEPSSATAEQLHDLRKAARRLRHTAESVTGGRIPVLGADAALLGVGGARIQSRLGDHRDAVLLAEHLATRGREGGPAQWTALEEAARDRAARAVATLPALLADLARARSMAGGRLEAADDSTSGRRGP